MYHAKASRALRTAVHLQEDEDQLFGGHIAVTHHRLTSRQKAMAKLHNQQVLIDVEFPEETNVAICNSYFNARFPKTY